MNKHKVVVFCGAHATKKYLILAYKVGEALAKNGYVTITGGGPGMMREVNRGAIENGGESWGICIAEEKDCDESVFTKYESYADFDKRHQTLIFYGDAYVILPGGLGTVYEALEITQKKKFHEIPKTKPLFFVSSYFRRLIATFEYFKRNKFIEENLSDLYIHVKTVEGLIRQLQKKLP